MNKDNIDKLINETVMMGGELEAITLSASDYDALLTHMTPLMPYPSTDTTTVLRYKDICIYKRVCKGCCRHD